MTREEIISSLEFTVDMFLFDPSTGEKYTEPSNDMDKTTIDACRGAIKLLEQEPCEDCISRQPVINGIDNYIEKVQSTGAKDDFISFEELVVKALPPVTSQEPRTGWNNHQIACMLADLFGDACACNYNGIDEWLSELCDFKDTCCPNPVGVACWEQFLKHSQSRYTESEE